MRVSEFGSPALEVAGVGGPEFVRPSENGRHVEE